MQRERKNVFEENSRGRANWIKHCENRLGPLTNISFVRQHVLFLETRLRVKSRDCNVT